MPVYYSTTTYRYPHEHMILFLTMTLVFLVIALTATATVCLSAVFVAAMLAMSYYFTRSHHQALMRSAKQVNPASEPVLSELAQAAALRLQVEPVEIYITPSRAINAYTFGLASPKVVVLHSALYKVMDRDEMQFIIGHELGHVKLGHTWLNSLVGGMAGIPSPYAAAALLYMAFRSWNRACEYSADRAGLLACANPSKAVTALIKLHAGEFGRTQDGLERAVRKIEAEDDEWYSNLGELLSTHPMIVRRINQLRSYSASAEYRRLQSLIDKNIQS